MSHQRRNSTGFDNIAISTNMIVDSPEIYTYETEDYPEDGEEAESTDKFANKLFFGTREIKNKQSVDSYGIRIPSSEEEPFYKKFLQQGVPKGKIGELVPRFIPTPEIGMSRPDSILK
jgi:hypothetical protein